MTVTGTISTSATPPVQVATYTITYQPGPNATTMTNVTPIAGWTIESTANEAFVLQSNGTYVFTRPATISTALPLRVVQLIDTGLFFDAPNNYGRTKLSNDPITNAAIDGLGYSTTDQLDARYEPIASSTNQLVTQDTLDAAVMPLATTTALIGRVPYTYTSASTFPDSPQQGDQHFLIEDIYPTATPTNAQTITQADQVLDYKH